MVGVCDRPALYHLQQVAHASAVDQGAHHNDGDCVLSSHPCSQVCDVQMGVGGFYIRGAKLCLNGHRGGWCRELAAIPFGNAAWEQKQARAAESCSAEEMNSQPVIIRKF